FNILAIDVRGVSTVTDFFLIAEGNIERHVQSLARKVLETVEESGTPVFQMEGNTAGDWIVLDCGAVMVHLFVPELREKYALEELWQDGKIVDLEIRIKEE